MFVDSRFDKEKELKVEIVFLGEEEENKSSRNQLIIRKKEDIINIIMRHISLMISLFKQICLKSGNNVTYWFN